MTKRDDLDSEPATMESLEPRRLLAGIGVDPAIPAPLLEVTSSPGEEPGGDFAAGGGAAWSGAFGLGAAVREAFGLAAARYSDYVLAHTAEQFADYTAADGAWVTGSANTWVAGFTPGVLWELDRYADREGGGGRAWSMRAAQWSRGLMNGPVFMEDVGFRMLSGLEPWFAELNAAGRQSDAMSVALRMGQEALEKLFGRWNETVGAFETTWRSSSNPAADFGTIIDQTYDLSLLQWVADYADPGVADPALVRQRVLSHAQRVADHVVRDDGSSYHWGYFNSTTGDFVQGETFQGYDDESTWARGQAWGILGFAEFARRAAGPGEAADPQAVTLGRETASRMADWFLGHLPRDLVPFWDFDDPAIPQAPRDSSAAAIAASGLFTLAALPGLSPQQVETYRSAAEGILMILATSYLSTGRHEASVLVHGSGNVPAGGAVDRGLIYGDYFFLRAANQWLDLHGAGVSPGRTRTAAPGVRGWAVTSQPSASPPLQLSVFSLFFEDDSDVDLERVVPGRGVPFS